MESVEESSHTMTEIDTANNIILEHAYSEEQGANISSIQDEDPGDSSSSSSLESPLYEPTTTSPTKPDTQELEPVAEPPIKEEPPKPEPSQESTKVNRELRNLLEAAKESNLDTNIVHKRESRKSMDPFGTKPVSSESGSSDKDNKMAGQQRKDGVITPRTPKGKRENLGDSPLGATSGEDTRKHRKHPFKLDMLTFKNTRKGKDNFCWRCHREGVLVQCETCPRSYHSRCLKHNVANPERWPCPECLAILQAESTKTRSPAMRDMSLEHLCELLKYAVKRMISCTGSEPFIHPVEVDDFPDYLMYVVQPMDLTTIQNNIRNNVYGSTVAFMADAKWILHNSIIYNSYQSKLTTAAKSILKICKQEMSEIETCSECYQNANTKKNSWFVEVCSKPHILLWAKLKGFPYWPAKAMTTNIAGLVDVRFFGAHDRAWIPVKECFLYSKKDPNPSNTKKRSNIAECIREVDVHIEKLKEKFSEFYFAPYKTPYDPNTELEQLSFMLPKYKPGAKPALIKMIKVPKVEKSENGDELDKPVVESKTHKKRGRSKSRNSDLGRIVEKKSRSRTPSIETPQNESMRSEFDELELMSSSKSSLGSDKTDKRNLFTMEFDKFMEGYGTEDDEMPLSLNTEMRKKMIMSDSESDEELSKTLNSSQEELKNGGDADEDDTKSDELSESALLNRGKVRTRGGYHNVKRKRSSNSPTLFETPSKFFRRNSDMSTKSDSSRISGISDKINRVDEFPDNSELNLANMIDSGKSKDGFTTPEKMSIQDQNKLKPIVLSTGDLYNKNKEFRISPQSKQSIADRLMKKISESEIAPEIDLVKKQILDNLESSSSISTDITKIVSSDLLSNIFEPSDSSNAPDNLSPGAKLFEIEKSPEFLHLVSAVEVAHCAKVIKLSELPREAEQDSKQLTNDLKATKTDLKQLEKDSNSFELKPKLLEKEPSENDSKLVQTDSKVSKATENDPTGFDKYLKATEKVSLTTHKDPKVSDVKQAEPISKSPEKNPKQPAKPLTSFEKYLKGSYKIPKISDRDPRQHEKNQKRPEKDLKEKKLPEKDATGFEKFLIGTEKDPKVSEKDSKVSEKEPIVSDKESKRSDKEMKISEKDLKVSENEPIVSEKDSKGSEKDPNVSNKEPIVSEKDPKGSEKDVNISDKDLKASENDPEASEKDLKAAEKDHKGSDSDPKLSEKDQKGSDRYPKRSARAPPKGYEMYAKISENDSEESEFFPKRSSRDSKSSEEGRKGSEKELRTSKRLEKLKISSSTESDDDKPLKKISENIKSTEESKDKPESKISESPEFKIVEKSTLAKETIADHTVEDKVVAEKQVEDMEVDSDDEPSEEESDSDEPIVTRKKKSTLVKLVNVSDIISGKINNSDKPKAAPQQNVENAAIEIKTEPISEEEATSNMNFSVTFSRVEKTKDKTGKVDNVTSVINDVAANYSNKIEETNKNITLPPNRKEITLRPISKLIQSPKQKARKSFPNSPHKMHTIPIQIKKIIPEKKEPSKPQTVGLKMISTLQNVSALQNMSTQVVTSTTPSSSKDNMVYIAPQPPPNSTLMQQSPILAMVQQPIVSQPSLIIHGPAIPPLSTGPSTSSQCAVVNPTNMDISGSSTNSLPQTQTLIDVPMISDDRSQISDTIAKAVGDLLCRQPPRLKPKPPGPLAALFDDGPPSSAGPTTKLINSVAHRFSDYFRGLLRETLEDLSALGNPESKIRSLELEIETLKQKHSEEMLELRKNISSILKDIQKSIVEEKAKIVDETRAVSEAERVRCVEEAKSKQWCAYCLKEARFYCCWNTSYCDYPCQQKHWATHMKTCSQSSVRPGTASNNATDKTGLLQQGKQIAKHTYTNNTKSVVKPTRMIVKQTTNKQGINMFSPVQRGIQPGQQTITLVESTPGNFEIVGNHGPISLGGKLVPATTIKVKPGNMLTVASTSTSSTSTTVAGTQKAIIVSQKPAPTPKVTSAPVKDTNTENKNMNS